MLGLKKKVFILAFHNNLKVVVARIYDKKKRNLGKEERRIWEPFKTEKSTGAQWLRTRKKRQKL